MVDLFGSTPQTLDNVLLTREECCAEPFKPLDHFASLLKTKELTLDRNSFGVIHR